MATYLKTWRVSGAIIRQRGHAFQVETHHNGRRKRQTFKTSEEAEACAKKLADELKEEGAAALAITGTARIDALRLLKAFPTRQVQGVGFRYTVMRLAAKLDVTGFVWNLPDGRLQLTAEGASGGDRPVVRRNPRRHEWLYPG